MLSPPINGHRERPAARTRGVPSAGLPAIQARRHAISWVHYLTTSAGPKVLAHGGTTIDAGAAGLSLSVLLPHVAMFGGVVPLRVSLVGEPAGPSLPRAAAGPTHDDTAYVRVIDAAGNGFSATLSDSAFEGSVIPGHGCSVSGRGAQTWLDLTHPSFLAPRKRPSLTPSPALAHRNGRLLTASAVPAATRRCRGCCWSS